MSINLQNQVIFLTYDLGINGAGNSASDYLQHFENSGFKTSVIFQNGEAPVNFAGNVHKLKLGRKQKLVQFLSKKIFQKFPTNPSNEQISLGFALSRQWQIKRIIDKHNVGNSDILIYVHWINNGFVSLKTLQKLAGKPNYRMLWHLHDLWPVQDIFHTPNTYHTESGIRRSWSLEGRPNILQFLILKRSRTLKKNLAMHCTYATSTNELREWLLRTSPYKGLISEGNCIVIPQPLISLRTHLKTDRTAIKIERNRSILIGGNHFLHDVRANYLPAMDSFIESGVYRNYTLKVFVGTLPPNSTISEYAAYGIEIYKTVERRKFLTELELAEAVVCPSLFETFGLVVLESLALNPNVGIQKGTLHEEYLSNTGLNFFSADWSDKKSWLQFLAYLESKPTNKTSEWQRILDDLEFKTNDLGVFSELYRHDQ